MVWVERLLLGRRSGGESRCRPRLAGRRRKEGQTQNRAARQHQSGGNEGREKLECRETRIIINSLAMIPPLHSRAGQVALPGTEASQQGINPLKQAGASRAHNGCRGRRKKCIQGFQGSDSRPTTEETNLGEAIWGSRAHPWQQPTCVHLPRAFSVLELALASHEKNREKT
jgi:hypothetical protein